MPFIDDQQIPKQFTNLSDATWLKVLNFTDFAVDLKEARRKIHREKVDVKRISSFKNKRTPFTLISMFTI